jgi:hypothetical protein
MGKQYNKVEKKRRRLRYNDRKREKAKAAASASKPKVRKSPVKKKEGAETAAAAE